MFLSWRTADTKEKICYDDKRPLYLLRPNGQRPITRNRFGEIGKFDDVDAYTYLSRFNLRPDLSRLAKEYRVNESMIGLYIEGGYYLKDVNTGDKFVYNYPIIVPGTISIRDRYAKIDKYGKAPYQLIIERVLQERPAKEILTESGITVPLKFSFDPDAIYEELPASQQA